MILFVIEGVDLEKESYNYLSESYKLFSRVNDIETSEFFIEIN